MWFEQMHPSWQDALIAQKPHLNLLEEQLASLPNLVPAADKVMSAFEPDLHRIRVVIVGQDPYPTAGVAVGRSFAVSGPPVPASLRNIFRELDSDLGVDFGDTSPGLDLAGWQEQGVLLLNRHLTAEVGVPGAHFKHDWKQFTDAAMIHLVRIQPKTVFVLWGKEAAEVALVIEAAGLVPLVHASAHPSPLSAHRGFFGSRPFSMVNQMLIQNGLEPIDWKA